MALKKVGLIVGGIVVLALVAVLVALAMIDVNKYKPEIEAAAEAATGRKLTIGGDIELSVSLSPSIVLSDITLANAAWSKEGPMVTVARAEAEVQLLPLLGGAININRFVLDSPRVILESRADGSNNWTFEGAEGEAEQAAESSALPPIDLAEVNVFDASITMITNGDRAQYGIDQLKLDTSGRNGLPLALDLKADLDGAPLVVSAGVGGIGDLVAMEDPYPVEGQVSAFGFDPYINLAVDLSGTQPVISGKVRMEELALPESDEPAAKGAPLFSDDPLPLDGLSSAAVDLTAEIGAVTTDGKAVMRNVSVPVSLSGGVLNVSPATAELGGGKLTLTTRLTSAGDLRLTAKGQGITADALARDFDAPDAIQGGPVTVDVAVTSRGKSVKALMAGLNGHALVDVGESQISSSVNMAGADVLASIFSNLNPFNEDGDYTVSQCIVANLAIANGVATSNRGIAFVTDKMYMQSSGTIDLGKERINLNLRPTSRGGVNVGVGQLTEMFKISGPLSNPGVGIDATQAVKNLGGALATGGLSVLGSGLFGKVTADADPCTTARQARNAK